MLRGTDPNVTRAALEQILMRLQAKNIKVLIAGMLASPSFGQDYKAAFDAIYPELATKYDATLYAFFLDGVTGEPKMTLSDGLHPNRAGVERIVKGILPTAEAFLKKLSVGN
jgi:acyl-CoA thioesterase-1